MWLIPTKKELKKHFNKIKKEISELTTQSSNNRVLIESNKEKINELVSKKEVDLMIREAILKVRESSPRTTPQTPRTPMRKKADKILNKVEIMQEMSSMLQKGLSTTEIHNIIVNEKMLVKKTCFFKYLKVVRDQTARTPRTTHAN